MLMRDNIMTKLRREEYYREAIKCLRAHPGSIQLLGEPIKELGFEMEDKENFSDGKTAHFRVKVKGSKERGIMYFWAERPEIGTSWTVNRIELELKNQPEKRLLVKRE